MAVREGTYGTIKRLQALIGDLVDNRIFTAHTTPSREQAESYLDDIAAEINAHLEQVDYNTPVMESDRNAYNLLVAANGYGAAVLILMSRPASANVGFGEGQFDNRTTSYHTFYKRTLDMIDQAMFPAIRAATPHNLIASGSSGKEGNKKRGIFRRGLFDYPGSRALQESDYYDERRT